MQIDSQVAPLALFQEQIGRNAEVTEIAEVKQEEI